MLALHNAEHTYLQPERFAFMQKRIKVEGASMQVRLSAVPDGRYSLTLYQDLNSNGKLDRNLLGMPAEPFGFSRNPVVRFGPPAYTATLFAVPATKTILIQMQD